MPGSTIIHLISCPRTLSTALMYAFAQRPDCDVIDEPFYGYFLTKTGAKRPDREATLAKWPNTAVDAQKWINNKQTKPYLFLKNMAAHFIDIPYAELLEQKVILYIRHPLSILRSYTKVVTTPTMQDIGLKQQWDIVEFLTAHNKPFVVVDSGDLLREPENYLRKICKAVNISFNDAMLSWPAEPKEYDGPWAKYWYGNLHKSTGFIPQKTSVENSELNALHAQLYQESLTYYKKLEKLKI